MYKMRAKMIAIMTVVIIIVAITSMLSILIPVKVNAAKREDLYVKRTGDVGKDRITPSMAEVKPVDAKKSVNNKKAPIQWCGSFLYIDISIYLLYS